MIYKRLQGIPCNKKLSDNIKENIYVLRHPLDTQTEVLANIYQSLEEDDELNELVEKVYGKTGTDMGDFWISFLEMSDPLTQNIHACHSQNGPEYISSSYDMLPGLLAYNNKEYARYLSDFWAMLSTLPETQKAWFNQNFAQSMSGLPYSCMPLDMWIETTMNLNSKLKQGWLHLLQNEKQLFSTTRSANNIARIKSALNKSFNYKRRNRTNKECQPARLMMDEEAVQDLLACLQDFNVDPFDTSNPTLRSLQSGIIAPQDVIDDTKAALPEARDQIGTLFEERIFSKSKSITARIDTRKRKNFDSIKICGQSSAQMKMTDMERSGLAAVLSLVEGSGAVDLERVLSGRVTEESLSLFNADGSMRKTAKSKLLEYFSLEPTSTTLDDYVSIIDMGMIWRLASPTAGRPRGIIIDGFTISQKYMT